MSSILGYSTSMDEIMAGAPPRWVESAEEKAGLDLLALRAPVMRIGNELLNGITTITPSIRYMTFVSWITLRYWERGGTDSRKSYLKFARRLEAAIVLGNLAVARDTTGLVGGDTALAALGRGGDVPLNIDVQALGANAYGGPAEQLGLLETRGDAEVPHLTSTRGIPLARQMDEAVRTTKLGRMLAETELPESATLPEIAEFGACVRVRELPDRERDALLDAILPVTPASAAERRRLASYAAFLSCSDGGKGKEGFRRMLRVAVRRERPLPQVLVSVLDGWGRYLVRDMLAVVHEHAFRVVLDNLQHDAQSEPQYVTPADVVAAMLQDAEPIEGALRDLALIAKGEDWTAIPFAEMDRRVRQLTTGEEITENGLRRWKDGLQEEDIIRVARATFSAAPALLPVAWLLAERRIEAGVSEARVEFRDLSHEGLARIGFAQIVRPKLAAFRASAMTVAEVAADLTVATVEQHLRTAWSRLAIDGKDVSVLLSDGNRWAYRKGFSPGQTDSRLAQLDNWLRQLGLVDTAGVTADGKVRLERIIATLKSGGDA